jgi:hypothetical protein
MADVNIFDKIRGEKTQNRRKLLLISALAIVAAAAVFATIFIVKNQPSKPDAAISAEPTAEIAERIDKLSAITNGSMTQESADMYIREIDGMIARTDNPEQRVSLRRLQMTRCANSDQPEKAAETGEKLLSEEELSEEQRFYLYAAIADEYIYHMQDVGQLRKYVNLMKNSGAGTNFSMQLGGMALFDANGSLNFDLNRVSPGNMDWNSALNSGIVGAAQGLLSSLAQRGSVKAQRQTAVDDNGDARVGGGDKQKPLQDHRYATNKNKLIQNSSKK